MPPRPQHPIGAHLCENSPEAVSRRPALAVGPGISCGFLAFLLDLCGNATYLLLTPVSTVSVWEEARRSARHFCCFGRRADPTRCVCPKNSGQAT